MELSASEEGDVEEAGASAASRLRCDSLRLLHLSLRLYLLVFGDGGIQKRSRDEQLSNAEGPISSNWGAPSISLKEVHPRNACSRMRVTLRGSSM